LDVFSSDIIFNYLWPLKATPPRQEIQFITLAFSCQHLFLN
jgi:hypothetical protein